MPIIRTMKSLRPVKRYFASAIAARNARAIEMATVVQTMIRLFFTSGQKNGVWIAARNWDRRMQREPRRVGADDLVVRLERRRDHPEAGKHHEDEEDDGHGVPAAARGSPAVHSASPMRTILRT